jgi:hypothetical protein
MSTSDKVTQLFFQVIYKNAVHTLQETHYVSATKPNRLMLFGEIIDVYRENHTERTNTLCGQNAENCGGHLLKEKPLDGYCLHSVRGENLRSHIETVLDLVSNIW